MHKLLILQNKIQELCGLPFEYGACDCYVFTAELVKTWHGRDYLALHNDYGNEKQTKEYVKKNGGLVKLITEALEGQAPCDPTECKTGDVVLASVGKDGEVAIGFVANNVGCFKGAEKNQLITIPLKHCYKGWRL